MADKKIVLKGRTAYNNSIVINIVTLATAEVEGVAPSGSAQNVAPEEHPERFVQKLKLDFDEDRVFVNITINIFDGFTVPDVAFKVQEAVKNGIENMTAFKVSEVDVIVGGVIMTN